MAPPSAASGETWQIDRPDGAAREPPVGEQGADLAEALRFQIAGRIEHLLHARPAARALIADDDHVARLDLAAEDALDRRLLALEDARPPGKHQDRGIDAGGLHDGTVDGDVAVEHGKAAVLGEGMLDVADDAVLTVGVERRRSGGPG